MDTVLKVAPSEPLADLTQSHSHSHSQTTAHQNVGQCTSESPQGDNQTTAHQNVGQCTSESPQGGRPKKPAVEKGNLQARYWSYLFDNLHRAVEELYTTCEADESVVECQVGVHVGILCVCVCEHALCCLTPVRPSSLGSGDVT